MALRPPLLPACHQGAKIREQALADSEAVMFASIDGVQLAGRLFGPDTATAGVVLAHMQPADQSSWFDFADQLGGLGLSGADVRLPRVLPGRRRRVLRGDEGRRRRSGRTWPAPWGYLRTQGVRRIGLVGASMGGTASLVVRLAEPAHAIDAVVTLSAPDAIDGLTAGPDVLQAVDRGEAVHRGERRRERGRRGAGVLRRVGPAEASSRSSRRPTTAPTSSRATRARTSANLIIELARSNTCPSHEPADRLPHRLRHRRRVRRRLPRGDARGSRPTPG